MSMLIDEKKKFTIVLFLRCDIDLTRKMALGLPDRCEVFVVKLKGLLFGRLLDVFDQRISSQEVLLKNMDDKIEKRFDNVDSKLNKLLEELCPPKQPINYNVAMPVPH
jgi:hypothetical protein